MISSIACIDWLTVPECMLDGVLQSRFGQSKSRFLIGFASIELCLLFKMVVFLTADLQK